MHRKLYHSEDRKIRAMLDEDFTDIEISKALHVAKSTVTNLRNGDQISSNNLERETDFAVLKDDVMSYDDAEPEGSVIGAIGKAVLIIGGVALAVWVIRKILTLRYSSNLFSSFNERVPDYVDPFLKDISHKL